MQPEIRQAWETMLELLEKGQGVLVASDSYGLPTIHNFRRRNPEKAYHESVKHLGYGLFRGRTENGEFFFDGGGAMRHAKAGKPGEEGYEWLSWCPLEAEAEVLKDLGYDIEAVKQIVEAKLGSVGPL